MGQSRLLAAAVAGVHDVGVSSLWLYFCSRRRINVADINLAEEVINHRYVPVGY